MSNRTSNSTSKRNVVFIITDTTNRHHLGCYGCEGAQTPHHDALAADGVCFDQSYAASPVCTPARGCVFSGLYAPTNGANFNDATCYSNVPLLGTIATEAGVHVGYTGKWHLDGGLYNGYGKAEGGFPQRWWYDGKCYNDELGPEKAAARKSFARMNFQEMCDNAFDEEDCWAHRCTNRALDFLETADAERGENPFLLCVAFDEPHGPFMCPRRFLEATDPDDLQIRPNVNMDLSDVGAQRRLAAKGHVNAEEDLRAYWRYYAACLSYVDYEIGRIVAAVKRLHGEDTVIILTSDHGEQMGSHNSWGKGYVPYQENIATPLIISGAGVSNGARTQALASQIDYVPTMCDLLGIDAPPARHGTSLVPVLEDPTASVRDIAVITHDRFGNNGEPQRYPGREPERFVTGARGGFQPWRGVTDGRYKLVIDLFGVDELYDLDADPHEMHNRITDGELTGIRDELHRRLLSEMEECGDPMRCPQWACRPWADEHWSPEAHGLERAYQAGRPLTTVS